VFSSRKTMCIQGYRWNQGKSYWRDCKAVTRAEGLNAIKDRRTVYSFFYIWRSATAIFGVLFWYSVFLLQSSEWLGLGSMTPFWLLIMIQHRFERRPRQLRHKRPFFWFMYTPIGTNAKSPYMSMHDIAVRWEVRVRRALGDYKRKIIWCHMSYRMREVEFPHRVHRMR
jgi:hypothetical protein